MNDYILRSLGYTDHPIGGDIVYTETLCNTLHKREKTLELFFEAYGAKRVLPLCEPLVSMYQYQNAKDSLERFSRDYGLIVSIGYKFCLIIPIVDGKADFTHSRRVSIGTSDCFSLMSKSFTLKYEHLGTKIDFRTLKVVFLYKTIQDRFSFAATNYESQLAYFQAGETAFKHQAYQHPLIVAHDAEILESLHSSASGHLLRPPTILEFYESEYEKQLIEEDRQRRLKMRQEQAARIREAMAIKREEKKSQHKSELAKLEGVLQIQDSSPEEFQGALKSLELANGRELERMIKKLKIKLGVISKAELVS